MPEGLWRKKSRDGKYWHTRIRLPNGRYVERSTGCTDLAAARVARRRLEREVVAAADPAAHKAAPYPIGQALTDFLADRERLGRAAGTLESYSTKAKHLVRLLGAHTDANVLQPWRCEELR